MTTLGESLFDGQWVHSTDVKALAQHYEQQLEKKSDEQPPTATRPPKQAKQDRARRDRANVKVMDALKAAQRRVRRQRLIQTLHREVGTKAQIGALVVSWVREAIGGTGIFQRHVPVEKDIIGQLLDNEAINREIEKEQKKRRTTRVSQFRFAMVQRGVTQAGMDALRFAMSWCPGHATLAKDKADYLAHLDTAYCPGGETIKPFTRRSAEEQAADAAAEAAARADEFEDEMGQAREEAREEMEREDTTAEEDATDERADDEATARAWVEGMEQVESASGHAGGAMGGGTDEASAGEEGPPAEQKSYGTTCLLNALSLMLIAMWWGNVVLPGSVSQMFGYKLTCDAAVLRNAPKRFRNLTTVMVQLQCACVSAGQWVRNAVTHMVRMPQSALRAFKLRCRWGKDDAEMVRAAGLRPIPACA